MALEPNLAEQARLAANRAGAARAGWRELAAELVAALAIAAAAAALWLSQPPAMPAFWPALLCALTLILANRVVFETPFGFTVATELAFVPALFALPLALVVPLVALSMALARLPEVLRRRAGTGALLRSPANAWFAAGPCAVFAAAGTSPLHAGAGLLLAALGAQFALDFGVSAARSAVASGASVGEQLRDSWVYAVDAALACVGLVVAEQMASAPYAVLAVAPLLGILALFANERRGRIGYLLELNDTYRGTALLLGDVISADDGYTGEHSDGVVELSLAIADALGLDPDRRRNLEFGAMLHDVGKVAVPKEIINKPGPLSAQEWEVVRAHPELGERMLRRVGGFMVEVGRIVRHHHERWDGGGYPDGLAGTEIPLESRIISCADAWSAMRTDRSYRRALPLERARAELLAASGSQLDPVVVAALLQAVSASHESSAGEQQIGGGAAGRRPRHRPGSGAQLPGAAIGWPPAASPAGASGAGSPARLTMSCSSSVFRPLATPQ